MPADHDGSSPIMPELNRGNTGFVPARKMNLANRLIIMLDEKGSGVLTGAY
jgi:hypothetical protein